MMKHYIHLILEFALVHPLFSFIVCYAYCVFVPQEEYGQKSL